MTISSVTFPASIAALPGRWLVAGACALVLLVVTGCTSPPPKLKTETAVGTRTVPLKKIYVFMDHSLSYMHMRSDIVDARRERHKGAKSLLAQKIQARNVDVLVETHDTSSPVMWPGVWLRADSVGASHVLIVRDEKISTYKSNAFDRPTLIGTEQTASYFELPSQANGRKPVLLYETSFSTDEVCAGVSPAECIGFVPNYILGRLDTNRLLETR